MKFLERIDKKELLIRILVGLLAVGLLVGLFFYASADKRRAAALPQNGLSYEKARVLEIIDDNTHPNEAYENMIVGDQVIRIEILTGPYTADQVEMTNTLSPSAKYNTLVTEGMTVIVKLNTVGDNEYVAETVYSRDREPLIIGWIVIFALALLLVGGKQGISAIFGLALTTFGVFFVLIPLLEQRAWPAFPTTLLIVSVTMFASYVFIGGLHTKAMTAALGAFGGVLLAALFAYLASRAAQVSGLDLENHEDLLRVGADNGMKIRDLFLCGILIAAEGAIMDISMSVASAVEEVHRVDPTRRLLSLFRSGMHIGRDAMGTMANTLILAFAGTGLNIMISAYAAEISFTELINSNYITMEIIQMLAGSFGMVLTVPVVALVAAAIFSRQKKTKPAHSVREK